MALNVGFRPALASVEDFRDAAIMQSANLSLRRTRLSQRRWRGVDPVVILAQRLRRPGLRLPAASVRSGASPVPLAGPGALRYMGTSICPHDAVVAELVDALP